MCVYRVTPVFEGSNLVASGVQMEAWSVEDAAKAFALTCTAITSSRAWKLIMPPAKVRQRKEKSASSVGLAVFSFIENGELKIENFGNAQSAFIQ